MASKAKKHVPVSGIYIIRNKMNGRIYVGSAVDCARRQIEHKKMLKSGKHTNAFLLHDYIKNAQMFESVFSFSVKEIVSDKTLLLEREQAYLDLLYDNQNNCYNLAPKAGSALGVRWSKQAKKNHSNKRKGNGNPMWNKTHSQETRLLMAKRQLYVVVSPLIIEFLDY